AKVGVGQGAGNLPGAVAAEVEEDHRIAIAKYVTFTVPLDDAWPDEFVCHLLGVRILDCRDGVIERLPITLHEQPVGDFRPLPAPISIHCIVPAHNAGESADAD